MLWMGGGVVTAVGACDGDALPSIFTSKPCKGQRPLASAVPQRSQKRCASAVSCVITRSVQQTGRLRSDPDS